MERTEIEELILEAEAVLKKWRLPRQEEKVTNLTWQELLDGKDYPRLRFGKL